MVYQKALKQLLVNYVAFPRNHYKHSPPLAGLCFLPLWGRTWFDVHRVMRPTSGASSSQAPDRSPFVFLTQIRIVGFVSEVSGASFPAFPSGEGFS
jgi:hypothetical protein